MIDYLQKYYEQLARYEREGAWREMARQVAHEIKNPLTPMLLKIQLLQRMKRENRVEWVDMVDSTLDALIEQIEILKQTAQDFADFAQINETEHSEIEAVDVLNKLKLIYHGYPDLDFHATSVNCLGKCAFLANNVDFMRVMINICNNAIQAMEGQHDKQLDVIVESKDEHIIFSITDNGMGIAEYQRDRIFEPNFTTKQTGTGLGLAISKKIVEQIGGTITFTSDHEKGTTFFVVVPQIS